MSGVGTCYVAGIKHMQGNDFSSSAPSICSDHEPKAKTRISRANSICLQPYVSTLTEINNKVLPHVEIIRSPGFSAPASYQASSNESSEPSISTMISPVGIRVALWCNMPPTPTLVVKVPIHIPSLARHEPFKPHKAARESCIHYTAHLR